MPGSNALRIPGLVCLLMLLVYTTGAQEFSERNELAVFSLSYDSVPVRIEIPRELQNKLELEIIVDNPRTGTDRGRSVAGVTVRIQQQDLRVPTPEEVRSEFERAFTNIDQRIRQVFVNIGRFDVVGESYSIDGEDVDSFVRQIRQFRAESIELSEEVLLGRQAFTESDFNRLADGYYLVIPSVSYYRAELTEDATYRVEIEVSFAFISMETQRTFERFTISSSGTGENLSAAISSAISSIPSNLDFRIRTVPEFQIRTGITDIIGRQVLIEFGRNMGLNVGDEFMIVHYRDFGVYTVEEETGLIYITDVRDNFSFGIPIYSNPRPMIGDQLHEVPRSGIEAEFYGGVQSMNLMTDPERIDLLPIIGIKATVSRGFYPVRPIVKVELPFIFARDDFRSPETGDPFFGVTAAIGAEYLMILGRLRFSPFAMLGITTGRFGLDFEDEETVDLAGIGINAGARIGWHLSRNSVLYIEPGFSAYIGIDPLPSVIGPALTMGINIK
ncbi:hypothetical protein [Spirochaeta dissipatitropha]